MSDYTRNSFFVIDTLTAKHNCLLWCKKDIRLINWIDRLKENQKIKSIVNALELWNMNEVIIFDFDGVLADSLAPMLGYAEQVCRELGISVTPRISDLEALEKMEFSAFALQLGVPDDQIETFVKRNHKLFSDREEPIQMKFGMEAVVSALAENNTLAIITGNSCNVVEKFLEAYGMRGNFQTVLCAEHKGTRLEKILNIKNQYSAQKAELYMIGDAVSDIRAAREAGVKSIAVAWGHQSKGKLIQEGPYLIIDEPEDLLAYFSEGTGNE